MISFVRILIVALLGASGGSGPGPRVGASSPERPARVEAFCLRADGIRGEVLGVARLVHKLDGGRRLLELEVRYLGGPHAVLLEMEDAESRRLVWREVGASAPTWMLELPQAGGRGQQVTARETRWGLGVQPNRQLELHSKPLFPLGRLEAARKGGAAGLGGGLQARPLAMGLQDTLAFVRPPDGDDVDRVVTFRSIDDPRDPGAWSFGLEGERLVRLRFRDRGPWWRGISIEEYRRLEERARRIQGGGSNERPE